MANPTSNPGGSPKIKDITPPPAGQPTQPQEFARFKGLASKLVQVPKRELDERRKP